MSDRRKVLELFDRQDSSWKKKAEDGIERYRKGTADLTLMDSQGHPLANTKVRFRQKTHEFRFGTNLFLLDELETEEKNDAYKKAVSDVFNMATLPFYWDALEPERGNHRYGKESRRVYRRPAPDLCIEFCQKHGIEPREHGLAYEAFFPKWLYDADVQEIKQELERRYAEISARYADKIPTIEVTNEMDWERGKTAFYGEADYVEWCFKLAERYFPDNHLSINEGTDRCWKDNGDTTDKYYTYLKENLCKGARIDAVGMQFHIFHRRENEYIRTRQLLDPDQLYRHMDLYAGLGKPLQITEVTVPAYSRESEDEQIQADIIERLYSVWFSHPSVEQIIYWNMADGYAHLWDPDPQKIRASQGNMSLGENYFYGGLLRFDLSPKPAYFRIKELIKKRWHTEEELLTDENGHVRLRGFCGSYEAEIDGKDGCICFDLSSKSGNNRILTVQQKIDKRLA